MNWAYRVVYYQNGDTPQYQGWNVDGRIEPRLSSFGESQLLSTLGNDGWELVAVANHEGERTFYFKKPNQ